MSNSGKVISESLEFSFHSDPKISFAGNANLSLSVSADVAEAYMIQLDLIAEAGMGALFANDEEIERWTSTTETSFDYSINLENLDIIELEFYLIDNDGDTSNSLYLEITPVALTPMISFKVDMGQQDVSRGVYINGDFLDNPRLMELESGSVYAYDTILDLGSKGDFYFLNGNSYTPLWGQKYYHYREELPNRCSPSITTISRNRVYEVLEGTNEYFSTWSRCDDSDGKERVCFFGNSVTQQGIFETGYISLLNTMIEESGTEMDLIGVGISGNTVGDLVARVDRDILTQDPDKIIIYIGLNDVWWVNANQYEESYRSLISSIQNGSSAEIVLATPTIIGEKKGRTNDKDPLLDEFASRVRQIAIDESLQLCDLRQIFVEYLEENNPDNLEQGILTYDGTHMSEAGNQLIAESLFPFLN